jgi:hypothetical protein
VTTNRLPEDQHATRKALWIAVETARDEYHRSQLAFDLLVKEAPSRIPGPDGSFRIERAGRVRSRDFENYIKALREFSTFMIGKKI